MALYDWGERGLNTNDPKHILPRTPPTVATWHDKSLPLTWFVLRPCIVNSAIHITLHNWPGPMRLVLPVAEGESVPTLVPVGEEPLWGQYYHCGHRRLIASTYCERERPIYQLYYAHQRYPNGKFTGTSVEWPSEEGKPLSSFFGFDLFTNTVLLFGRERVYKLCVLGD